jgi:dye decolorizing peroxidase
VAVAGVTRRGFLGASGAGAIGVGVGAGLSALLGSSSDGTADTQPSGLPDNELGSTDFRPGAAVAVAGEYQGGIVRPATAQPYGFLLAADVPGADLSFLAPLGARILALLEGPAASGGVLPAGPADMTVTVGLGPRLVASVDPAMPGAAALPVFATDSTIPAGSYGGDLMLAIHGSDPTTLRPLARALLATVAEHATGATQRWSQRTFRGPSEGTTVRNPLGFLDGIVVSSTDDQLRDNVWIAESDDPRAAGGTILCLRKLRIDLDGFMAQTIAIQEAAIGRRRDSGAPLSGGDREDEVDLGAKAPDGAYLVPADAHARAAHPATTGSSLMLRRSYAYDDGVDADGAPDAGLMFVSFQRDLRSFSATLQRMEDRDAMLKFTTARGGGTWLVLPGFSATDPLGASLT